MTSTRYAHLIAADAAEFLANLRRFAEESPRSRGQIAAMSGLPRSTVYHFTSQKNTALPKNEDQVRAFLTGCKALQDDAQVAAVLRNWRELTDAKDVRKTEIAPEAYDEGGLSLVEDKVGLDIAFRPNTTAQNATEPERP
ncbi:hypothetical protein [Nocardia vaccinii]|uniref:hypothetical protein n=1 Tax=Nocardia vaccinii TaxID=1822 RepID=UPI000AB62396|nr:hypothetical protein [Nocardia vaccinii]